MLSEQRSVSVLEPRSPAMWREARRLIEEYAATLDIDLSFQGFTHEIDHLADEYSPPTGGFLLAEENAVGIGCVGLRRFADGVGEIKRLYVAPSARGLGLGRTLAEGIVRLAQQRGYGRLLLDTLPTMTEAHALYRSLGFVPISAYRFNPVPGTAFLALDLP
jgi:carbonic anhydrase